MLASGPVATTLVLLLAAVAAPSAEAFPWLWLARPGTCGKHPQTGFGPHLKPATDKATVFVVTLAGSKKAISSKTPLCPGRSYNVRSSWSSAQVNRALMTTTKGKWKTLELGTCPTSTYTLKAATSISNQLVLPCSVTGSVWIRTTHSAPGKAYATNVVSYRINPKCAAPACKKTG